MNTKAAAFIRCGKELEKAAAELSLLTGEKDNTTESSKDDLSGFFRFKETLLLSRLLYDAMLSYISGGGKSRGSYVIVDSMEDIEKCLKGVEIDVQYRDKVLTTVYKNGEDKVVSCLRPVRPIPVSDTWFEKVWREYRDGTMYTV